jgi:hypothetical protein
MTLSYKKNAWSYKESIFPTSWSGYNFSHELSILRSKIIRISKSFVMKLNTDPKKPNFIILNAFYRELEGKFRRGRK